MKSTLVIILTLVFAASFGQMAPRLQAKIDLQVAQMESKIISWREHLHQYPELSNREFKTAAYIAEHLKKLGLEVQTGVAHTGVVALLKTGKPGPVIGLRADMDALPVTERNSLAFASKEKAVFNGQETGVMHACGHDSHVAILMGMAELMVQNKSDLIGTIKFIFQPAEEGPPAGEEGGAYLMVKEGVLENPKVDVVFGLHIQSIRKLGMIAYKPAGLMAASDWFTIKVYGKQSHGSSPWMGIDPIVVSAQIISGLQTIVSRQMDLTKEPAVISVGRINAGIRENIIPEYAEFSGTIRTLDPGMQEQIHQKIQLVATNIAESAGARAEVIISKKTPITYNNLTLTEKVVPSLQRAVGASNVQVINSVTGAEDFAFYGEKVPAFFFFVGACPPEIKVETAPSHHTPDFMMDNRGMLPGLKSMAYITLDYMFRKN